MTGASDNIQLSAACDHMPTYLTECEKIAVWLRTIIHLEALICSILHLNCISNIYIFNIHVKSVKISYLAMFHVEQFYFRLPFHVKLKTAKTLLNSGVFEGFRLSKNNFSTYLRVKKI